VQTLCHYTFSSIFKKELPGTTIITVKVVLMTTPFNTGQKHGVEKCFHQNEEGVLGEDGVLVEATPFKEGQLNGEEKKWNRKGVLMERTTFYEGHVFGAKA
jgi:antitoxin component YwqK of YwqJK toxin-antitoxin module